MYTDIICKGLTGNSRELFERSQELPQHSPLARQFRRGEFTFKLSVQEARDMLAAVLSYDPPLFKRRHGMTGMKELHSVRSFVKETNIEIASKDHFAGQREDVRIPDGELFYDMFGVACELFFAVECGVNAPGLIFNCDYHGYPSVERSHEFSAKDSNGRVTIKRTHVVRNEVYNVTCPIDNPFRPLKSMPLEWYSEMAIATPPLIIQRWLDCTRRGHIEAENQEQAYGYQSIADANERLSNDWQVEILALTGVWKDEDGTVHGLDNKMYDLLVPCYENSTLLIEECDPLGQEQEPKS